MAGRCRQPVIAAGLLLSLALAGFANAAGKTNAASATQAAGSGDGDATTSHYSALDQVDHQNVWRLEQAWKWSGDGGPGAMSMPIRVPEAAGGALVFCTDGDHLHALDPATGRERWQIAQPCTGLAFWHAPSPSPALRACADRILVDSGAGRLTALDAQDGKPCTGFGDDGQLQLGAAGIASGVSPPVIANGNVIVAYSGTTPGGQGNGSHHGFMAVDAGTGAHRWTSAVDGGALARGVPPVVDDERKLVVVETSDGIVALRSDSGKLAWQFQFQPGGLPDHGSASAPLLVDISRGHRRVPAVVVVTSRGTVISLDRITGAPLAPEQNVTGPQLTPDDAWGLTFWDQAQCRERLILALENSGVSGSAGNGGPSISFPTPANAGDRPQTAFDPVQNLLVTDLSRLATWFPRNSARTNGQLFVGPTGLPCTAPPWSILLGVDLANGGIRWTEPLRSVPATMAMMLSGPSPKWKAEAGGSLIVTAGGLAFLATNDDRRLHGYALDSGRDLWSTALPAQARSMPLTYLAGGRQYVVIAGGNGPGEHYLAAYALPKKYLKSAR